MKLLSVLASTVLSSHYRGGTYIFTSNADGTTTIQQTQTWRDSWAGTSGTCRKRHEGTKAYPSVTTRCSRGYCQSLSWPYIVGFSSNGELGRNNDYCYGSYDQSIRTPSGPFKMGWSSCCWVGLKDDYGRNMGSSGRMEVHATVNDPTNNSPVFTHPPLWRIMSGCDGQKIDLSPVDPDGDTVKCRWAKYQSEGGGATYNARAWPSLSLDEDNCIVHYTGSMDRTDTGVKAVGIIMEDRGPDGRVRSSIPVQFLAAVWTPSSVSRGVALPFVYPDWFGEESEHEDHEDHDHGNKRHRRTTTPSYCQAVPVHVGQTPDDGAVIESGAGGSFEITLQAQSSGGYIKSFTYEKPALMTCTNPNSDGSATCTWTPTDGDTQTRDHGFCFLAADSLGLTTERRCVTLRIPPRPACSAGFEDQGNGNCQDIDECSRNTHNCNQNAECSNTPGSFTCACLAGYRGDGVKCEEIDECAENIHACDINAACNNTPGAYDCTCNGGWEGNGSTCVEIDECATGVHACHNFGTCTNTAGSYDCTCNDGFLGDGFLCTVPCATFYDTPKDSFLTNTSAFTTGTFDVSNLETFDTTPSQDGDSNWKLSTSFDNKASFVAVKSKCTLEGYTGKNFGGNKLGEWNGGFNNENVFQLTKQRNNNLSSFKCNCNKEQSCNSFYTRGKNIPAGCPKPTCNVDYEITDAWGKHGAHNTGHNNRNNQPIKFGYVFKIKVPAEYWTRKGFSILIRWRNIQSASFQLWNANFFNIYRKNDGIDVLIHSRPYDANWDRAGVHEFVFVADRLAVNSLPEMFFFDGRQMKHSCFQFGLRGEQVGRNFESAIEYSDAVNSYEDVNEVYVPRMGNVRVKA